MNWVEIGGASYDVLVTAVEENFNILYSENTGRTMSQGARMTLDPLGTFYGHKITFQRKKGNERDYDLLWDYVSQPRYDGIKVKIVHNQYVIEYDAYISQGTRNLKRIDPKTNKVYWESFQLNIVPMEAQVKPL